eukprot:3795991-Pyramimonas_sp.AAC.2
MMCPPPRARARAEKPSGDPDLRGVRLARRWRRREARAPRRPWRTPPRSPPRPSARRPGAAPGTRPGCNSAADWSVVRIYPRFLAVIGTGGPVKRSNKRLLLLYPHVLRPIGSSGASDATT